MRLYKDLDSLPPIGKSVVTVGSFDGVHAAHQGLLDRVVKRSRAIDAEGFVVTFEPHPRIVLGKGDGLKLLTTVDEKIELLSRMGVDNLLLLPFTLELSGMDYATFVRTILLDRLSMSEMVVGFNHRLGHDAGNFSSIDGVSDEFVVEMVEPILSADAKAEKISSTLLRRSIESGDFNRAVELLSHPYLICGQIQGGELFVDQPYKLLPVSGRYLAQVDGEDAELRVVDNTIRRVDGRAIIKPKVELKLCFR